MKSIIGMAPSASVGDAESGILRGGGGWRGLAWLTWRQHRWMVAIAALAVLAEVAGMLATNGLIRGDLPCPADSACLLRLHRHMSLAETQIGLTAILPGFVAAFWGAPLIAQEYEQRTHLLAWCQDISPRRWLAGKLVLVGGLAVILAVALGGAAQRLAHVLNAALPPDASSDPVSMFKPVFFEASPMLIAAYTICGFALGTAAGALWRRSVPAMGVTLVAFAGVRLLTRIVFRLHYLPPRTVLTQFGTTPQYGPDVSSVLRAGDFADAHGHLVSPPGQCTAMEDGERWDQCMRDHGIHQLFTYQPGSRILTFQMIEAGIFVGLAVVFLAIVWCRMRRV
jgi:hypothetical protein